MREHTKGRLTLFVSGDTIELQDEHCNAYRPIVGWMGFDNSHIPIATRKANARRLVACWNACLGIDDPEAYLAAAHRLTQRHDLREFEEIEIERDELLALLRQVRNREIDYDMVMKIDALVAKHTPKER